MKKILYCFLVLVFICGSVLLVGCNEEDKFWENTNILVTEFANKTENAFLTSETTPLTYPTEITTLIEQNSNYSELSTYYSIAKSFMAMFNKQHVNLTINPNVNKKTKSFYNTFENKINNLQNTINTFLTKKLSFEQHLAVLGNYTDSASLQELTLYKRELKKLIDSTLEFNGAFENLYQNAYLSIPTEEITLHQVGYENLILSVSVNKILKSYVKYIFEDSNGLIPENTNQNALTQINILRDKLTLGTYKENTLEIINQITVYSQMFDNEIANFYTSLQVVNMEELFEDGKTEYLANHAEQVGFVNQIDRFNQTVLTTYTNQILELCA